MHKPTKYEPTNNIWTIYSILELRRSRGQNAIQIRNQIEDVKEEIAEIVSELNGESGWLFEVDQFLSELLED